MKRAILAVAECRGFENWYRLRTFSSHVEVYLFDHLVVEFVYCIGVSSALYYLSLTNMYLDFEKEKNCQIEHPPIISE